ncbi:hypothetical protein HID58_088876, partial [Brassica napus]
TDQFGYLESSAAGIRQTRFVQIKRLALATAIGGEEERARDGDFPSSFKHRLRSSFTLTELRARPDAEIREKKRECYADIESLRKAKKIWLGAKNTNIVFARGKPRWYSRQLFDGIKQDSLIV